MSLKQFQVASRRLYYKCSPSPFSSAASSSRPEEALCSHPGLTHCALPSLRISAKVSPTLRVLLSQGSAFLSKYLSAVSEPSSAVSFTNLSSPFRKPSSAPGTDTSTCLILTLSSRECAHWSTPCAFHTARMGMGTADICLCGSLVCPWQPGLKDIFALLSFGSEDFMTDPSSCILHQLGTPILYPRSLLPFQTKASSFPLSSHGSLPISFILPEACWCYSMPTD